MIAFRYTVIATFDQPAVAEEWIAWMTGGHLADVRAGGALAAEVVRLDGEPLSCEARYVFASRADFERYEREHAPRLRAEGLQRFPPERGVRYRRTTGECVATA